MDNLLAYAQKLEDAAVKLHADLETMDGLKLEGEPGQLAREAEGDMATATRTIHLLRLSLMPQPK